jgi:hypothetical protein
VEALVAVEDGRAGVGSQAIEYSVDRHIHVLPRVLRAVPSLTG